MIFVSESWFHVYWLNSVLNVKAVVATFNQEKTLVVCEYEPLCEPSFQALVKETAQWLRAHGPGRVLALGPRQAAGHGPGAQGEDQLGEAEEESHPAQEEEELLVPGQEHGVWHRASRARQKNFKSALILKLCEDSVSKEGAINYDRRKVFVWKLIDSFLQKYTSSIIQLSIMSVYKPTINE